MLKSFKSVTKILTNNYSRNFSTNIYDVCVIGGGPGGYIAAIKASQLGLKTVCVEKRGTLGGTCLNVGCIPSKALLNISHKYEEANKHFAEMGIDVKEVSLDFTKMMKKKDNIVTKITSGVDFLFRKYGVDYVKGWGSFKDKNTISVNLNNGSQEEITSKNIIIATGSEPTALPFLPFDEETFVSSTGALALKKVPKHLIVIGGGVIGCEMGSIYKRLGAEVTVVEYMDRICSILDAEITQQFQKILTKQGIKFLTSAKVTGGKKVSDGAEIYVESVDGKKKQTLKGDVVLISTGRRPNTDGLRAKEIGLKLDNKGRIGTNHYFQTNIPNIYAIGDVIAGPMLAHKAEEEGIACAEMLAGKGGHVNYNAIPNVVYTHPELASVGKTEEELKAADIKYKKGSFPFVGNSRAKANDDTQGLIKILAEEETGKILGIHILGAGAGEMIAEGTLGLEYGASAEDIGRTSHAHPTLSEAFREACMSVYDKPIHV